MTLFDLVFDNITLHRKALTGGEVRRFIEHGCVVVDGEVCRDKKLLLTGDERVTIGWRTIQGED